MESSEQTWLFRCVKGLFSTGGKESDIVINMIIGCLPKWPCPYPTSTTAPVKAPGLDPCAPPPPPLHPAGCYQLVFGSKHPTNAGQQFSSEKQRVPAFLPSFQASTLNIGNPSSDSGALQFNIWSWNFTHFIFIILCLKLLGGMHMVKIQRLARKGAVM